ncbi:MAG: hypothetical protein WCB46_05430 [Methanoregula sp.]
MTEKKTIIEELGEEGLLLPVLINRALIANDRIKYFFSLLQTARDRADHPERALPTLRAERESAGIETEQYDIVVEGTRPTHDGQYTVPLLNQIVLDINQCTGEMIEPFVCRGDKEAEEFNQRKNLLAAVLPDPSCTTISADAIRQITSAGEKGKDSLHQLVIDLHKGLNALQAALSNETIDGALTYMLGEGDDQLVRAFMKGLNRTKPLKFDHPGLGTTATRTGDKLQIQNDIGVTDAHVLVINIVGMTVSIIYTDIHMQRLDFFQSLFDTWKVRWEDTRSRKGDGQFEKQVYHLSTGTYSAQDSKDRDDFLTHLGSRIVFLIDWNRARKQLRTFVLNKDSIAILRWAAGNDFGHRGFLVLGGDKLIYGALEIAARIPLRYGEPLHQILGTEKSVEYLQWVFKAATQGLLTGQPRLLIQDEIKAELLRYFRSAHEELIEICIEHASLMVEVATAMKKSLLQIQRSGETEYVIQTAKRAKDWESSADQLVARMRMLSRRVDEAESFFTLIRTADDALDELEEACFFTTLLILVKTQTNVIRQLTDMAEISVKACQEYLKVLIAAQGIRKDYSRDEIRDFLTTVNRVRLLEHECDDALRLAEKAIITESTDFRELRVYFELAQTIEASTNSLMKSVFIMHDTILEGMKR